MATKRLIDANALKERAIRVSTTKSMGGKEHCYIKAVGTREIDKAPTVDAVEVVHGRWIVKGQEVFCSHCDKESGYNHWGASAFSDYCPNCGAKMDGDGNG